LGFSPPLPDGPHREAFLAGNLPVGLTSGRLLGDGHAFFQGCAFGTPGHFFLPVENFLLGHDTRKYGPAEVQGTIFQDLSLYPPGTILWDLTPKTV
jgi:hypothetical protein